ncbi:hypothetical protein GJ496_009928 [Pomphorhynchus laevis]|nr:hypothetical protein GJ496_009928 [Pomphorhynchus laevis]
MNSKLIQSDPNSMDKPIKVSGLSAGLKRRRLSLLSDLCEECGLELSIEYVQGTCNKADELTRVPKYWLSDSVQCCSVAQTERDSLSILLDHHRRHHWVSDRTLFLAKRAFPDLTITKKDAINIVKTCNQCNSIDLSHIVWNKDVMDVTHFNGALFLTAIDCGPSRFSTWKHLRSECVSDIFSKVTELFFENGWPSELLVDNDRTFRSNEFVQVINEWGTKNSAAEHTNDFSPADQKYTYARKLVESNDNPDASTDNRLNGQSVYVKPAKCKCTTPWNVGTITGMDESRNIVEVNQVPYHQSCQTLEWCRRNF